MSDDIDWGQPISLPRGAAPFWMREEQLRRATLLLDAAGTKLPRGSRAQARRVEALAAVIPGLRYRTGRLVSRGLAPDVSLVVTAAPDRGPGRGMTWNADRRLALLQMVEEEKASSPRPLTDAMALKRVKRRMLDYGKALAEQQGEPFHDEAKRRAELPSLDRLANLLADARRERKLSDD